MKDEILAKMIVEIANGIIETTNGKKILEDIDDERAKTFMHMIMLISLTNKIVDILKKE